MKFLLYIYRWILSRRYNVKISGGENMKYSGPLLLLSNHIALVDPQILMSFLGGYKPLSPLASDKYYNITGLKQIMDLFETIPIGEITSGNDAEKIKKVFLKITQSLESGKHILIYPSGQIYRQGYESIIGKKSAYNIAKLMPKNTKVIGVRIRGLWGSSFSMAWNNGKTKLFTLLFNGIWILVVNFIFFVPKRKITLEIQDITSDINQYKKGDNNNFNKYLEDFYNKPIKNISTGIHIEEITYVPHYFFYNNVKNKNIPPYISESLKEMSEIKTYNFTKLDQKIISNIINKIAKIKNISPQNINKNSNLIMDLSFDSLDLAEIKSYIQVHFKVSKDILITHLKSVGDLIMMASGKDI